MELYPLVGGLCGHEVFMSEDRSARVGASAWWTGCVDRSCQGGPARTSPGEDWNEPAAFGSRGQTGDPPGTVRRWA